MNVTFSLLFLLSFGLHALGAQRNTTKKRPVEIKNFDIRSSAQDSDWNYFFSAKPKWRLSLWEYHQKLDNNLADWHWTWRIGWIKACTKKEDLQLKHCKEVIKQGIKDKALVVRAEIVAHLSTIYGGTQNSEIVELLKSLYQDNRNNRNGEPLYIQKQIIYALKDIGGTKAAKTAAVLAKSHPITESYHKILKQVH